MEEEAKLSKKMKENPSIPIGVAGLVGVLIYGIYNFKNRKEKLSIYLIHLRVAAQSAVIGTITLGVLYSLCKNNYHKLFPKKEEKNN